MQRRKSLLNRLNDKKRVSLTPRHYRAKIKLLLLFIFILTFGIITSILLSAGVTFLSLGICLGCLIISTLFVGFLSRRVKSTAIKGDTLILKSIDNKPTVTSIRSVGHIRSHRILGIECTTFRYNLDGTTRRSLIINRCGNLPFSTANFIEKAIEKSKKEKKANHKLGPVATN